jgi:hypothetical protein
MDSLEADSSFDIADEEVNVTSLADRLIELRYLVPFREIGIEVVLARKAIKAADFAVRRDSKHDSELYGAFVRNRERSR